ncbi:MAG TPA: FecR family protein [Noviherbaspirillum sp.]|uniref:FecR family protein n=1 Tax=Noviherbaspirillum sp. TaxID=1926288 RepID=UPI002D606607|nr:FecR family protein [Noviherbaspirillum sp.]HYD94082.1 FecR family protein [Noviherbaspirillum sp.]
MKQPRRCIATKTLLFMASLLLSAGAWAAQAVGTVVNLSGPLLAKKADGSAKVLSLKSAVEQGDTLISEKSTYARIKFIDNSEITLKPGTQLKIDDFSFEEDKPEKDSAAFNLVKGGLRAVTGTLGKRNKEKFGMNTPTATIGIRGTTFIAEYVAPDDKAVASYGMASLAAMTPVNAGSYADARSDMPQPVPLQVLPLRVAQADDGTLTGLRVHVIDGMVNLSNGGGSQDIGAGQFGHAQSFSLPPVTLPADPGIQFTPPPQFQASTGPHGSGGTAQNSEAVDCEVR